MNTYEFSLILNVPEINEELENALFKSGCDDALLGVEEGIVYLDFSRQSDSFSTAVSTAIRQVESTLGKTRIARIEPDEIVTLSEISTRIHRTRESVRLLASGKRGEGNFPLPLRGTKTRPRIWRWSEVAPWLSRHGISIDHQDLEQAEAIALINAVLQIRRSRPQQGNRLLEKVMHTS